MGADEVPSVEVDMEDVEFHEPDGKGDAPPQYDGEPTPPPGAAAAAPVDEKAAQEADMVMVFHIVAIVCAVLSIVILPIAEIVPAVMGCCMFSKIKKDAGDINIVLNLVNFIVTLAACLIYVMEVIIITIYTFGIGIVLILFVIPFLFVIYDTVPGLKKIHLLQQNQLVQNATGPPAQPAPVQEVPPGTIAVNYNDADADNV